ncbi:MAG: hypothetical protein JW982_15630 [Spirochaetes bacterium]|nr:hypothetical protein [Spirochaetota bacterium]
MSNLSADSIILNMQDSEKLKPDYLIDEAVEYINSFGKVSLFSPADSTCGTETELQTCVRGSRDDVDLPVRILNSGFYKNLLLRIERKEIPVKVLENLNIYLNENKDEVWENSWVYFDPGKLSPYCRNMSRRDMSKNPEIPDAPERSDYNDYFFRKKDKLMMRVPVSYFIKLSLAEFYSENFLHETDIFKSLTVTLDRFLSDNTSPETLSLHVCRGDRDETPGSSIASETLLRFLLTSLAVKYGNMKFDLYSEGQECEVYFSPHVPIRQKNLSRCISDNFYRELFMNPCLSGWTDGESKKEYMSLCHMALSRSYLNTLIKLKDSGILHGNMIMMPDFSNVSLGNNGIHLSIGSDFLSKEIRKGSVINEHHEKALGDLMIKIIEYFLPLYPGYYSSAPYRTPQKEFRPEKRLGFLPHELDNFHLRNLWKRWRDKTRKNKFGQKPAPGYKNDINDFLDNPSRLSGDFLRDHRLVDYPAAFISSDLYCPLNGITGSDAEFKNYLHNAGIFDRKMSLYLLFKLREFGKNGFTGFEARFHSLFRNFSSDMKFAADLQILLQMLAYRYISEMKIRHYDILSDPFTESERRYSFFSSAVGIRILNFKIDSNSFMQKRILSNANGLKKSARYKGFYKISHQNYLRALVKTIEKDGEDIIAGYGFQTVINDLKERIDMPEKYSSVSKITRAVVKNYGKRKYFNYTADRFNMDVEKYYRENLKTEHLSEGMDVLLRKIKKYSTEIFRSSEFATLIPENTDSVNFEEQIMKRRDKILNGIMTVEDVEFILKFLSLAEYIERRKK